jgi:RHH-type rel operon transcriptional repressor/antitoxin RelB
MLAIRLPADIESRLEALAKTTGRTKTFYARRAILEYLDDLEDWYLADKVVKDVRSGKEETTPLKDVMREYGLLGD